MHCLRGGVQTKEKENEHKNWKGSTTLDKCAERVAYCIREASKKESTRDLGTVKGLFEGDWWYSNFNCL